jgi:serine/threonine protein phosphatase PrpC
MIPIAQAHLGVAAISNPGRQGKNNEDRYSVSAYILTEQQPLPSLLAIVADGIGGHRGGEIAAEMAVESISRYVAASAAAQPTEILKNALVTTSQAIYTRAQSDTSLQGMGTTCACCWIIGDRLYTTTVGDSRIYLIREKGIRQISTDHTWIQDAIDLGAMTPEQAANHPNRHIIRRFLGSTEQPQPDTRLWLSRDESDLQAEANQGMALRAGDRILLCTDGLTDLVKKGEIFSILQKQTGQNALDKLVELANKRGGYDNITVILLENPGTTIKEPTRRRQKLTIGCLTAAMLVMVAVAMVIGNWLWDRSSSSGSASKTQTISAKIEVTLTPGFRGGSSLVTPVESIVNPPVSNKAPGVQTLGATPRPATLTPWPTNTP